MSPISRIAGWLAASRAAVAFTGAGISTESGIPDFRSPNGVWAKYRPVYFDEFCDSAAARQEYWRQKSEAHREFHAAQPNAAHRVLADWERRGQLRGVITQNIDGLHQLAGSQTVLELHGTARQIGCLSCAGRWDADPLVRAFLDSQQVPECPDCGGLLKHATISFGQALPEEVLEQSVAWSQSADLFFALGSSLVVHPAAGLPQLAHRSGAKLVIINRDPTPLDGIADEVLRAPLGETLTQIEQALHATALPN